MNESSSPSEFALVADLLQSKIDAATTVLHVFDASDVASFSRPAYELQLHEAACRFLTRTLNSGVGGIDREDGDSGNGKPNDRRNTGRANRQN